MRIFKATRAVQPAPISDDGTQVLDLMGRHGLTSAQALHTVRADDSWDLLDVDMSHGATVAGMCARLDAYDAAVAREGWRARVLADAGEAGIGDVIAVGITTLAFLGYAAWFGSMVQAVA
jgi:hypothetical protein